MAEAIGVSDEDLLSDLQTMGYHADTIRLVELTPLIHLAWVDGSVSVNERELIFLAAAHRSVLRGSRAHAQLGIWLDQRPSGNFFCISLRAIQRMLERVPAEVRTRVRRTVLSECTAIATASGGVLGWGKVSENEQRVMDTVTAALDCVEPVED